MGPSVIIEKNTHAENSVVWETKWLDHSVCSQQITLPFGSPNGKGKIIEEVLDYRTYCETMAGLLLNLLLGYC